MDIIELAVTHRAALLAEIGRLDAFLDMAARLSDGASDGGDFAVERSGAMTLRRPFSVADPDAKVCGIGVWRSRRPAQGRTDS